MIKNKKLYVSDEDVEVLIALLDWYRLSDSKEIRDTLKNTLYKLQKNYEKNINQ